MINSRLFLILIVIFITITGFILFKSDGMYNTFLFTIHKLLAILFVILNTKSIVLILKDGSISKDFYLFLVLAIISICLLVASGAFMSISKKYIELLRLVHSISTGLLIFSTVMIRLVYYP